MHELAIVLLARRRVLAGFLQALKFEETGDFAHAVRSAWLRIKPRLAAGGGELGERALVLFREHLDEARR